MSRRLDRHLTAGLAAATAALGLLVAAPAAQAVGGPQPTMSISPRCGPAGTSQVEVVVANVDPADNTFFTLEENEAVALTETATGPGGRLTLALPALTNDVHRIEMWLTAPDQKFGEVVASQTYQVPCPTVTVSPRHRARHEGPLPLNLAAGGYYYGDQDVVFRLDGVQIAQATPGQNGQAGASVTLPAVPDCGSHLITTDYALPPDAPTGTVTTAQTTLVTTCPTLAPDPASVTQSALPMGVQVTGAGWDLGSDVALSIDGGVLATVTTDAAGQFSTTVPLAARPCGTVAILGVELPRAVPGAAAPAPSPAPRAATSVEVTCPTITPVDPVDPADPVDPVGPVDPSDPTPPAKPAPTLVADPVVSSGGVARASGHGFTPGATVRLDWVMPDTSIAPGGLTIVAAADGSLTTSCLVFPHARLGPRMLRAEQAGVDASAPVLVVNGPMEPGRNRLLGRR